MIIQTMIEVLEEADEDLSKVADLVEDELYATDPNHILALSHIRKAQRNLVQARRDMKRFLRSGTRV